MDTIVLEIGALFESTAEETFGYVKIKKNKIKAKTKIKCPFLNHGLTLYVFELEICTIKAGDCTTNIKLISTK